MWGVFCAGHSQQLHGRISFFLVKVTQENIWLDKKKKRKKNAAIYGKYLLANLGE